MFDLIDTLGTELPSRSSSEVPMCTGDVRDRVDGTICLLDASSANSVFACGSDVAALKV
jgi:hypothetical protein